MSDRQARLLQLAIKKQNMRQIIIVLLLCLPAATFSQGLRGAIKAVKQTATGGSVGGGKFTQSEAADAIKEALTKGAVNGVDLVSVTDGYFKNPKIKIPFPKEAEVVASTLRKAGMGSLVDKTVLALNRAAEGAAKEAKPIFINSIKQLTVQDAVNIVSGTQQDAATRFLERSTTEPLVSAFKPSIKTALDKSLATRYWKDCMTTYNRIPFVRKINPDLPDYVTRKAISGLFYMISLEEAKIRKDPLARSTDLLKKVFGSLGL
jgi:hypothetical protein